MANKKDTEIVDWYCEEEWCSFIFTVNAYKEMFMGVLRCIDKDSAKQSLQTLLCSFLALKHQWVTLGEGVRKLYAVCEQH